MVNIIMVFSVFGALIIGFILGFWVGWKDKLQSRNTFNYKINLTEPESDRLNDILQKVLTELQDAEK